MAGPVTLSDLLGYASIACWLGAQFPQVLENYRRKSCEGLALPFLANWLLGDISNLVGCILTNQLPFQTYLATYFVAVDCTLVAQYFYYYKPPKLPPLYGHPRLASTPGTARHLSVERGASRYRTLSTVAANVAAAAALAAQQQEAQPGSARTLRPLRYGADDLHPGLYSASNLDDDDVDDAAISALADSFHSEGGRKLGRKRLAYSIERHGRDPSYPPLPPQTPSTIHIVPSDLVLPSQPLRRDTDNDDVEVPNSGHRSSRANRRGASMVFLGAWALFGIGTLVGSNRGVASSSSTSVGRLLLPDLSTPSYPVAVVPPSSDAQFVSVEDIISRAEGELDFEFDPDDEEVPQEPPPPEPSADRVLGRIFAWLCTTLYLTSRLPQIWKNYVRKSVEGLSMYLFVFAFLGNVFYVASILLSPKTSLPPPASTEFLRESIPYLLGSGGTLMFDITIVTQSFIYRPRPKRHLAHSRLSISEEEAGLLSADALHPPISAGESAIMNRGRTSRTRSVG